MNIRFDRATVFFLLAGIIAIFLYTVCSHFNYTPDDTYIYLQFARNIINGHGVSFNPGQPTYGVTSPLWLMLVSGVGAAGIDLYQGAKWLDILFASSALLIFYLFSLHLLKDKAVSIIAVIIFSSNSWFLRWTGTGMETSLAVFLIMMVFLYLVRQKYHISTLFASLLTLTRPEGGLMMIIILLDLLISKKVERKYLHLLILASFFLLILAPWMIFASVAFGTFIPNTMGSKVGFSLSVDEMINTAVDTVQTLGVTDGILILIILLYLILCFKKRSLIGLRDLLAENIIFFGWCILILAFYILSETNVVSRYLLLLIPVIIAYGLHFASLSMKMFLREKFLYAGIFILTASIMIQNQIFYHRVVRPGIEAFSLGMENCLIPIGKWINENTDDSSSVLVADVGAIGYFSERRLYDAAGLISPEFYPLLRQGLAPYAIIESGSYPPGCKPDFIIHRASSPEALADSRLRMSLITKPFFKLSLSDDKITYYTVYKIRYTESDHNK